MFVRPRRFTHLAIGTLAVVLLGLAALSRTATAFNPQPDPPAFGIIGIAQGQTARFDIVEVQPGPCTPAEVAPGPCRVQLTFLDADGRVVLTRSGAPAQRTVTLEPGRAASLDLNADELLLDGLRTEIRVVARSVGSVSPGPCRLTLEIFNNVTNRTSIFYPGSLRPSNLAGR